MKRKSLKLRLVRLIVLFSFIIISITASILSIVYTKGFDSEYTNAVASSAEFINSTIIDGDLIDSYAQEFKKGKSYDEVADEKYIAMQNYITKYSEKNSERIDETMLVYIVKYCDKGLMYVMDSYDKKNETIGQILPYGKDDMDFINNLDTYKKGTMRYSSGLGQMYSAGIPIYTTDGMVAGYLLCEYTTQHLNVYRTQIILLIVGSLVIVTLVSLLICLYIINKNIVRPINMLSSTVENFVSENDDVLDDIKISKLKITTNDEIETLYHSICTMESNIKNYVKNIKNVTAKQEHMNYELNTASKIQMAALPHKSSLLVDKQYYDLAVDLVPAKEVGGDFYDCFMINSHKIGLVIADVSGKSVPGALCMMNAKSIIKVSVMTGDSLEKSVSVINNMLCDGNETGMFVTAWIGVYDIETATLSFVNAGHNPPFILQNADGFKELDKRSGLFLGAIENVSYKEYSISLKKGDCVFLYTDGITESNNEDENMYGETRLKNVLNASAKLCSKDIIEKIKEDVSDFSKNTRQFDDMTMMCLKVSSTDNKDKFIARTATNSNLPDVFNFIEQNLKEKKLPTKFINEFSIISDELLNNIVSYSQANELSVKMHFESDRVIVTYCDNGIPFNPETMQSPDITIPLEQRKKGGLGIFIVHKLTSESHYEYLDGKNIYTAIKKIDLE